MGFISIILGFATVVILMVRRWNPIMVGLSAAAVVIFLNKLPYGTTMTEQYFTGFCTMFQSLFPVIFSGSLLAQIYNRSGAVNSIGDALAAALFRPGQSPTHRYISCILAMVTASGVLAYCGMNSLVTLIAMYPIALRLMDKAGIPKRFVMGILSCGVYTFAISGPGSAEVVNVLAMQVLGTNSYAGLCGGIVAVIAEILVTTVLTTWMIKRAAARGETFQYGPKDMQLQNETTRPPAIVAMIPLAMLVVLFNVFSVQIFTATMAAWLLAVAFFWRYLPNDQHSRRSEFLESCSAAGTMAFSPCGAVGSIVGFTSIVQTLPEFQTMLDAIFQIQMSPVLILIVAVCVVAALTSSSSSAIRVGVPMIAQRCQEAGLSAAYIHRVSCFASSIVDTMPYSTAVMINLGISDLSLKEAYPAMFVSTTLATFCGTVVCAVFMYFFPYLP